MTELGSLEELKQVHKHFHKLRNIEHRKFNKDGYPYSNQIYACHKIRMKLFDNEFYSLIEVEDIDNDIGNF